MGVRAVVTMEKEELDEIIECLPAGRTLFHYYPGRYAICLAAEELGVLTSPFRFAENEGEYRAALDEIGYPCVVKPVMSSSGKGQSTVRNAEDADAAWTYAVDCIGKEQGEQWRNCGAHDFNLGSFQ